MCVLSTCYSSEDDSNESGWSTQEHILSTNLLLQLSHHLIATAMHVETQQFILLVFTVRYTIRRAGLLLEDLEQLILVTIFSSHKFCIH